VSNLRAINEGYLLLVEHLLLLLLLPLLLFLAVACAFAIA